MRLSLALSTLCATALAAPSLKSTPFTATFDDIPGSALLPEVVLVKTPYPTGGNLAYNDFAVFKDAITNLPPPSGSQVVASFFGEAAFSGKKTANITSLYKDSKVQYFDLQSTQLGCVLATQSALAPVKCTVVFTGTKRAGLGGGTVTASATFPGGKSFTKVTFPANFKGLTSVAAQFDNLANVVTTVFFLDNVQGISYQ